MKTKLRVAIISEKLGTPPAHSTTTIALEALNRGHKVFEIGIKDLFMLNQDLMATAKEFYGTNKKAGKPIKLNLGEEIDVIHFRPNPPVDMAYLTNLYMLNSIRNKVIIANNPEAIIKFPEKFLSAFPTEFIPPTLITSSLAEIKNFAEQHEEIIIKPAYYFGGKLIFKLKNDNFSKSKQKILALIKKTNAPVIAQKFLPEISQGDKRILIINGEPIGAFMRVPAKGKYLANISIGGRIEKCEISPVERKICSNLRDFLVENQIFSAGIDIIGEYLTELNITSPGGFFAVQDLYGINASAILWTHLEKLFSNLYRV